MPVLKWLLHLRSKFIDIELTYLKVSQVLIFKFYY
jgi:hypothetical protein